MKANFLFLLLSFCFVQLSAQDKVEDTDVVLKVDVENKKIFFPVQFVSSDQILEVFACTEQGPTHETVLLIQPIGIKLHEALKKLGISEAIHWQYPLEDGFQLTMGDKVMMKMYFDGKPESEAIFVEDLLVYNHTETPAFLRGWSFKGDLVAVEGNKVSPIADVEFSLINKGRNKSPVTLLLNPSNFIMIDEPEFKVAPKYKPLLKKLNEPDKTKGTIFIVPTTEELIATENAKRYVDKDGLLTKNIEFAKKIDSMKKKFINETRKALMDTIGKGSLEGIAEAEKNKLIQQHQSLTLSASCDLFEINYLYHQMAKNEYEYLLKAMNDGVEDSKAKLKAAKALITEAPKDATKDVIEKAELANKEIKMAEEKLYTKIEATKTFKLFAFDLVGFLTIEMGHKFQAKVEESLASEAKFAKNAKLAKEHETKKNINLIYADIQPLKFRQIAVTVQIDGETKRLAEPEIANSKIMKDTFEKSINKSNLERNFFKGIENYYLKKIQFLQDTIKEGADFNNSNVAAKVSLMEAVNLKFAILENAHKERLKLLAEYMKEDKKEEEHYKKKIAETEGLLKGVLQAVTEIKEIIKNKVPETNLEELEIKYQEHLNVQ